MFALVCFEATLEPEERCAQQLLELRNVFKQLSNAQGL